MNGIQMQINSLAYAAEDLKATFSTLRRIFDNINQHPNDDKHRKIKLTDESFTSKVWDYPDGKELMKMSGWVVEGDYVRLIDDSYIQTVSQLLKLFLFSSAIGKVPFPDDEFLDLFKAISNGDIACIQKLLKVFHISRKGEICTESGNSYNLLHAATSAQQIDIVKLLLTNYYVDPYFASEDAPLCYIVEILAFPHQSFIQEVLKYCTVPTDFKTVQGYSLLHVAVMFNRFNIVKFLLEECSGTDVNATDDIELSTPLHIAYRFRRTETAQYLIQHGADVCAVDSNGCMPYAYIDGEPDLTLFTKQQKKLDKFNCSYEEACLIFESPQL